MSVPHELCRPDRIYPVNDSHQCRSIHALADGHAEGQNKSRSGCQSVIQICCETTAALSLEICGCLRLGPAHSFRQHKRRGDGNEPGIAQRVKRNKRRHEKQQRPEKVPATEASDNIASSHHQEKLGEVFRPASAMIRVPTYRASTKRPWINWMWKLAHRKKRGAVQKSSLSSALRSASKISSSSRVKKSKVNSRERSGF